MRIVILALMACKGSPEEVPVDADGDGFSEAVDCDDTNADVHPGAVELCNGIDDDCDGVDDDLLATWFTDEDSDGFAGTEQQGCEVPSGAELTATDCDDTDGEIHPSASEVCDGVDNNCDALTDEEAADLVPNATWFEDLDGDGAAGTETSGCTMPAGAAIVSSDCNDLDSSVHPAAAEICDGIDNDCDSLVDDLDDTFVGTAGYADADADGFGDPAALVSYCVLPPGVVANSDDCDDTSALVSPAATELCNSVDDDCDGVVDDAGGDIPSDAVPTYEDLDGDGFGAAPLEAKCTPDVADILVDGDCDDASALSYPGAFEHCDGFDNDCAGDGDAVGVSFFPTAGDPVDLTSDFASGADLAPTLWSAPSSGSLQVCGGSWFVNVSSSAVELEVVAHDVGGVPVLDGGDTGPVFEVTGGSLSLTGLEITGGLGNGSHSTTFAFGGGVHCDGAELIGVGLDLHDNAADLGGAIGAVACETHLSESTVWTNTGLFAGGIFQDGGTLRVENTEFSMNNADFFGGAVYMFGTDVHTPASFIDSTFTDNIAGDGGAALLVYADSDATCISTSPGASVFARNTATTGAVQLVLEPSSFQSAGCDFSEPGPDDNPPADIYLETTDESLLVGNDAVLICTGTMGCLLAP